MRELLFMEPVFKEAIWGGTRLKAHTRTEIAVLPAEHGKDRA